MRHRNVILVSLVLLLALTVCQVSAWSRQKPKHIQGFHVVKRLSKSIVAGSTYEWEVSFVNPQSKLGWIDVALEISEEHGLGFGEFMVEAVLESYDNPPRQHRISTLTLTESEGGIFQSRSLVQERFNIVKLKICSVPNLMPGTYTFTLTVSLHYDQKLK